MYREYLKSETWKELRIQALERASFKCEFCGAPAINAHHVKYSKNTDPLEALVAVCIRCHWLAHGVRIGKPLNSRQERILKSPPSEDRPKVPQDVLDSLSSLSVYDDSRYAKNAVYFCLRRLNFQCVPHYPLGSDLFDIYAERGNERLVIQVDRRIPRARTLKKMQKVDNAARIICLRGNTISSKIAKYQEIDAIIILELKTFVEKDEMPNFNVSVKKPAETPYK